ncbi:transglutaminase [Microvirga tunisiensis]|uniref:Transglutaminase n=3 Tax=Pannonibacter tanglangensis TaxID=2750084 RepID=A0A7X5F014_9HYPH|nr:transglutaminase [Pannonibacter sp. XCT-34]NBN77272.1 transglutaminase [Pannonibacter sp. XCT-53]
MMASSASANPGRFMAMSGVASAPVGHQTFCSENPGACTGGTQKPVVVKLSEQRWNELLQVNDTVNKSIRPVTDKVLFGQVEYWTYPTAGAGDCEEYVLEKQRVLAAAGWPASALLITVVKDLNNEGHAVLTVRTDQGDVILDNQIEAVLPWYSTPYRYVKRQSTTDPSQWTAISDTRVTTVASIGK